ncbi:metal ABC transporter permease [Stomatohabitans albus]|uniref:metal ABC transporter permease n=1 Tax=Stomatohabitans albus TaxID=3110766 RepID=UPI00300D9D87
MGFITAVALLAIVSGLTCALPGTFLVLRHQSMLVEAMSHTVLPGIVIGVLISGSTYSPIMIVTATSMGIIVVLGAHWIQKTGLVVGDANQGLIFPVLFAIGVLILSTTLSQVHISEETVLAGDINLMALEPERIILNGIDIGPRMMWIMLSVFLSGAALMAIAYPVLKISTFDPVLAESMGLPVKIVDFVLMIWTSLTVVVAFNTVGAILVVALMIVPPATALLVAKTLPHMLAISLGLASITALIGFYIALQFDLGTASTMATFNGIVFLAFFIFLKRRRQNVIDEGHHEPKGMAVHAH